MGDVSIWMINTDGTAIQDTLKSKVLVELRNSILVPPGRLMIENALVRASFFEGMMMDEIGVREVSMELMNILYPDQ